MYECYFVSKIALMLHTQNSRHWTNSIYQIPKAVVFRGKEPDVYVPVMGRFFSDGQYHNDQVPPGYSLHVIQSGSGIMEMEGVPYPVEAGDVFMFFPGRHIRYHDTPATPWRYTWLVFEGKNVLEALKHVGLTREHPHRQGDFASIMEPIFHEIEVEYSHSNIPGTFAIAAGWRILDALAHHMPEIPSLQVSLAEMARTLMDRDEMYSRSVEGIATQLNVSRSTLFRNFRSAYHVSPKTYLEARRIDQACRLLKQGYSSIKEIAAACGYTNAQHFCRVFRRKYEMTPNRFRKISLSRK